MNWMGGSRKRARRDKTALEQHFQKVLNAKLRTALSQERSAEDDAGPDNSDILQGSTAAANEMVNPLRSFQAQWEQDMNSISLRLPESNFKKVKSTDPSSPLDEPQEVLRTYLVPCKFARTLSDEPEDAPLPNHSPGRCPPFHSDVMTVPSSSSSAVKPLNVSGIPIVKAEPDTEPLQFPAATTIEEAFGRESLAEPTSFTGFGISADQQDPGFTTKNASESSLDMLQKNDNLGLMSAEKPTHSWVDFPVPEIRLSPTNKQAEDILRDWDFVSSGELESPLLDKRSDEKNTEMTAYAGMYQDEASSDAEGREVVAPPVEAAKTEIQKGKKTMKKPPRCTTRKKKSWIQKPCYIVIKQVKVRIQHAATQTE